MKVLNNSWSKELQGIAKLFMNQKELVILLLDTTYRWPNYLSDTLIQL